MAIIGFFVEVSSTGDRHQDHRLFLDVLRQVAYSTIEGKGLQGVNYHGIGECTVPFFSYNAADMLRSPTLPEVDLPHGVYRHLGAYAAIDGDGDIVCKTYQVPMQKIQLNGKPFQPIAIIHIDSRSLPNQPTIGELRYLPEQRAA